MLSRVCVGSRDDADGFEHAVLCLEASEKPVFENHLRNHGVEVRVTDAVREIRAAIAACDIVQIEWWHHPRIVALVATLDWPAVRSVVWAHVAGRFAPVIAPGLLQVPHAFLFSTPASLDIAGARELAERGPTRLGVVHSSGGFDDIALQPSPDGFRLGYLGTIDFAKLHPDFCDFLAATGDVPETVLIGEPSAAAALTARAAQLGFHDRLRFVGWQADPGPAMARIAVLAYLLNPRHYGTTENALLESMARGVVPIVLRQAAEQHLVTHGQTGFVVSTPEEFADAVGMLSADPSLCRRIGLAARADVLHRFSLASTITHLNDHYRALMDDTPRAPDFRSALGTTPSEWFIAGLGAEAGRFLAQLDRGDLLGTPLAPFVTCRSKSSPFHFARCFPADETLAGWTRRIMALEAAGAC